MPGSRLLLADREEIRVGIERDESLSGIARRLGRHPSTVCREVAANGGREGYRAVAAQERASRLSRRPKPCKLVADPDLAERAQDLLETTRYSPRTVSHLLRQEGWEVSAETLYRACYQPGRGLGTETWKCLPRRRQRRKHAGRRWGSASGNPLGAPVSVHRRHPVVGDRTQPGHLEGDLLIGHNNQSAVIVLTERTSRRLWIRSLPNGYGAEAVAIALVDQLENIPPRMRRTLTVDQGRELKYWAEVQAITGTLFYFCDAYSPWQKPTVENQNGLLRRWLPKGTRLDTYTQDHLDRITQLANNMPRPIHQWRSATDIYHQLLVATTG